MIYLKCAYCGSKDVFLFGSYDIDSKQTGHNANCGNCGKEFTFIINGGEPEEVEV